MFVMCDKQYSDKCLTLCVTFNCHSIVNKFTACMNSVFMFWWTDEQIFLLIWINEMGKNQDKSINKTSVSLISTNWFIQSISIKSDLLIFIDLSIDKSIPVFIDWLLRACKMPIKHHQWMVSILFQSVTHFLLQGDFLDYKVIFL